MIQTKNLKIVTKVQGRRRAKMIRKMIKSQFLKILMKINESW